MIRAETEKKVKEQRDLLEREFKKSIQESERIFEQHKIAQEKSLRKEAEEKAKKQLAEFKVQLKK